MLNPADPIVADAYETAKEHAAVDGAFSERLMWHWFLAAWDLCAEHVGLIYPPAQIEEAVTVDADGAIQLSHKPSSDIRFYSGGRLVAILAPDSPCFQPRRFTYAEEGGTVAVCPSLCCYCNLTATYTTGLVLEACEGVPAWFVQAVCRIFIYVAENRGETEMDEMILRKSGAKAFLANHATYVM